MMGDTLPKGFGTRSLPRGGGKGHVRPADFLNITRVKSGGNCGVRGRWRISGRNRVVFRHLHLFDPAREVLESRGLDKLDGIRQNKEEPVR